MRKKNKKVLQEWIGYIEEIYPKYFKAKLYDLTMRGNIDRATIPLKIIKRSQLSKIQKGAKFTWKICVGEHFSSLIISDFQPITEQELKEINTLNEELTNYFERLQ